MGFCLRRIIGQDPEAFRTVSVLHHVVSGCSLSTIESLWMRKLTIIRTFAASSDYLAKILWLGMSRVSSSADVSETPSFTIIVIRYSDGVVKSRRAHCMQGVMNRVAIRHKTDDKHSIPFINPKCVRPILKGLWHSAPGRRGEF